jgi:PAS domain-containing protein
MPDDLHCFDKARFGVIKLDLGGKIEYANEWSLRMFGLNPSDMGYMQELVADETSAQIFETESCSRRAGYSGDYSIRLRTRGGRGKDIRVQVLGTPVVDRDGTVRATIGVLQNLEFDDVIAELRGLGEAATDARTLFGRLTDALARVFEFDALVIGLYDDDGRFARVFFRSYSEPEGQAEPKHWERPWIHLSDAQREWVNTSGRQRVIGNLPEFLENPLWKSLQNEPAMRHFLELGIKSAVGLLVRESSSIVASLSLMSKRPALYTDIDVRELDALPLDKCILAVLHNIRRHEMEFHFDLLQQLLKHPTVRDMADHLVKAIGVEYRLSHVALLRVDWAEKRLQLQAQWHDNVGRALPANYEQPVEQGIMGAVVREGAALYIPDVRADSRYVHGALEGTAISGSEFCWPVFYDEADKRVAWVFNIEDGHVDSLSPREQNALAKLAIEVGGLLQRMNDLSFLKAAFASTSDPIVIVDENGEIKKVNPAASRLFGVPPPGYLVGNFRSYLDDEGATAMFCRSEITELETVLRIGDSRVPTLFSSCSLPESLGGKVLLIKDMRPIRRMEELSYLGQVSQEVSLQGQTPLALAATWVQRLRRLLPNRAESPTDAMARYDQLADLAARIASQLKRVQLALTRLALYDQAGAFSHGRQVPINLQSELQAVLVSLPRAERKRVDFSAASDGVEICGNPVHCAFVVETCIAFLLRHLPDDKGMSISLSRDQSTGRLEFRGSDASNEYYADNPRERYVTQLSDKLGLAEGTLRSILAGFGGTFERRQEDGGQTVLTLSIPLARQVPVQVTG